MFTTDPALTLDAGQPTESERAAAPALLRMIWGIHISRCVYAVAELGIADLLADGAKSASELAADTGSARAVAVPGPPRLGRAGRVRRSLTRRRFELTAGRRAAAVRGTARACGAGPRSWRRSAAFARSPTSSRRSGPVGPGSRSSPAAACSSSSPDGRRPPRCSTPRCPSGRRRMRPASPQAYDFSDMRTVVDVGGGNGTLLVEILRRHAHLSGVLFEAPAVAARADALLDATDLADRCEVRAGDFFERVPAQARLLRARQRPPRLGRRPGDRDPAQLPPRMSRGPACLIVERLIPDDGDDPVPTLLSDINMLVLTGGKSERTPSTERCSRRPG